MSRTVTLDTVWLNDAEDPADRIELAGAAALKRTPTVDGRVQRVAGGGLRMIRRAGAPRIWDLSLNYATRDQIDWLEAHLGRTVTARDHRGHKIHAVYLSVPVDENAVSTRGSGDLQLQEVTHTEAV